MAALADPAGTRGPDHLAECFLPDKQKTALRDEAVRDWVLRNRVSPGMYEFMIARTLFFDETLREALSTGIPQVVFLGAGYDTRSWRFREDLGRVRLLELDMEPTQRRKRDVLARAGIPVPGGLTFVAIDFRTDPIGEVLRRAGFDREQAALFIWEGVTYYLPAEAVAVTLAAVRAVSAAGSSICFDYSSRSPARLADGKVRKLGETMRSHYPGEPTSFSLQDGEIGPFLESRGYRIVRHLTAEEMETRYLPSAGCVPAIFCFVHAAAA